MKFFEWQLVRCRTRYKFKELRRTSWRRKISAAVIGCGVRAQLLVWIGLVSFELATLFPIRLLAPSKLVAGRFDVLLRRQGCNAVKRAYGYIHLYDLPPLKLYAVSINGWCLYLTITINGLRFWVTISINRCLMLGGHTQLSSPSRNSFKPCLRIWRYSERVLLSTDVLVFT